MDPEYHYRENYFSDDKHKYEFHSEIWGRDFETPQELISFFEENLKTKLQKTKDDLYWSTGSVDNGYYYIVIVPSILTSFKLFAEKNDIGFSNYSKWMLNQIREGRKTGIELFFTDYKGKYCLPY